MASQYCDVKYEFGHLFGSCFYMKLHLHLSWNYNVRIYRPKLENAAKTSEADLHRPPYLTNLHTEKPNLSQLK